MKPLTRILLILAGVIFLIMIVTAPDAAARVVLGAWGVVNAIGRFFVFLVRKT